MTHTGNLHFISRAFPPVIGGIENQNYSIYTHLKKHFILSYSINKKGKKALPFFLVIAFFRMLFIKNNIPIILGDGVLTILPWLSQFFLKKNKVICIVHGLDITYNNKFYQWLWVNIFFHRINAFIAVSKNTRDILVSKGLNKDKIFVVPNGFDFKSVKYNKNENLLKDVIKYDVTNKFRLLTLGRLVKRKGIEWFIKNVVKKLDDSFIYIIAGDGPEKENILNTIKSENLSNRVFFCGKVPEKEKEILLSNCHLFIQPNIPVYNDVEGFGISVIEASAYKLPVIASNLEGLKDAIIHKKNGWLVSAKKENDFIKIIQYYKNLTASQRKTIALKYNDFSKKNYDWEKVINVYLKIVYTQKT